VHDVTLEHPFVLLKELPKLPMIGPRRKGGRMDSRTGFRWATVGVSGVVLATVMQGGQRYTSVPAILRFFDAIGAARASRQAGKTAPRRTEQQQSSRVTNAELDRLGI